MKEMEKKFKLLLPRMPNYIFYESPSKQEGFSTKNKIHVSELSFEEAELFAELMRHEFLKHWDTNK